MPKKKIKNKLVPLVEYRLLRKYEEQCNELAQKFCVTTIIAGVPAAIDHIEVLEGNLELLRRRTREANRIVESLRQIENVLRYKSPATDPVKAEIASIIRYYRSIPSSLWSRLKMRVSPKQPLTPFECKTSP